MPGSGFITHCATASADLARLSAERLEGKIAALSGLTVHLRGMAEHFAVGDRVTLHPRVGSSLPAEVVGFREGRAQALTLGPIDGLGPGTAAVTALRPSIAALAVSDDWIGRVIDPLGHPLDGRPAPLSGPSSRPVRAGPPGATRRARLGPRTDFGVRALDLFATCRHGQRLGLFAGSGVGKSSLLGMLARDADCDVVVLGLVGERGREVREFLEDELGSEGQARSVTVVATSDAPPLLRREAAYAAMTVAEHFRDQGRRVLLLMDSLTRFCLAQREIGLAAGEPPTTRGFPPSTFAELPRLLERAGPGQEGSAGVITALFTVLVEGDDHNEPVADAVRGTLDGHVVLDRRIAEQGRYPAIDILRSLSRTATSCLSPEEAALIRRGRGVLSLHAEVADLLRLGAYKPGLDPGADAAIALAPRIEAVLRQDKAERCTIDASFSMLRAALASAAS
jgi:flagellum-specific ATP synthase